MTILVDRAIWRWRGRVWAHLVSDANPAELHDFAARLGLRRAWFQGDHYDVPAQVREHALALGAQPVEARELVVRLRAAGLRTPRPRAQRTKDLAARAARAHATRTRPGNGRPTDVERGSAMSERDGYAPGVPSWIDLTTSDPEAAKAFYAELLGWDLDANGPETGGYVMCRAHGRAVAGINGQPGPAGFPPSWVTYLATDDLDATIERLDAAGGTVHMGPLDVMDQGRMALAADPNGAMFGLWQAGAHIGAELVNEPGAVVWNELATDDLDAAQRFYGALFDYGFDTVDVGSGSGSGSGSGPAYRTFSVNGDMVGGMLQTGADWPEGSSATWTPYLAVDDIDAAAQHVETLGGSVRTQPTDSPFGRWSAVADPQGAALILLTMPEAAAG